MPVLEILSNLSVMLCFNGVAVLEIDGHPDNQSFDCTAFVWKFKCKLSRLFGTKSISLLTSDAAVGKAFSVFTYDADWTGNRAHNLPVTPSEIVTRYATYARCVQYLKKKQLQTNLCLYNYIYYLHCSRDFDWLPPNLGSGNMIQHGEVVSIEFSRFFGNYSELQKYIHICFK